MVEADDWESPPNADGAVTGAATSGGMLALTTVFHPGPHWRICLRRTRLYQLTAQARTHLRGLAAELHQFFRNEGIAHIAFCRTMTGYGEQGLADEARIEAMLQLIPGVEISIWDSEEVAQWALQEDPAWPINVGPERLTLAQMRAIELAQFQMCGRMQGKAD